MHVESNSRRIGEIGSKQPGGVTMVPEQTRILHSCVD